MDSVYDKPEGLVDGMMAFQACHLCHNGGKKCERPLGGGKCIRCANRYISQAWASGDDPPVFSDEKISNYTSALIQALPGIARFLFENASAYCILKISGANSFQFDMREPPTVHFCGPLTYDNIQLIQVFDNMIHRNFSTPKVDVIKDPEGLVARACLAGGYLNLFFSVHSIVDESENPENCRALVLGLAHIILMRFSALVKDVMPVAYKSGMSRNARLSLAALHVIVNRVKIYTSRLRYLLPFYDDAELSKLLKDRIHTLEAELRQIFTDDCNIVKDWGAPLSSSRKEFKNTTRSFDPLTMKISVMAKDELTEGYSYPITINTPSDSGQSPPLISSLMEIGFPSQKFAGLEDNRVCRQGYCEDFSSLGSSPPNNSSCTGYMDTDNGEPFSSSGIISSFSGASQVGQEDNYPMAASSHPTIYSTAEDMQTDWDLFFNLDQMASANHEEQDLGSPNHWGRDPGNYDDALE